MPTINQKTRGLEAEIEIEINKLFWERTYINSHSILLQCFPEGNKYKCINICVYKADPAFQSVSYVELSLFLKGNLKLRKFKSS